MSFLSRFTALVLATFLLLTAVTPLAACTRVVYLGDNDTVITARSMDWKVDVGTNLWVLPRGTARTGQAGPQSIKWTSKYGSIVATGYDVATTDGMNEKGLVANLLWLVESEYPDPHKAARPPLAVSLWAQYVLDNFSTVSEAVTALEAEPFTVITASVPGEDRLATLHLSMSDATGDSAIVEYVGGKQYYWRNIGGTVFLPGTNRAADRFARAAFYVNAVPKNLDPDVAVATAFSIIRNASVPLGINTPEEPNISSTRWRTVADHKRLLYFFESALTPNTFWVDLKQLDFSPGAKTLKLDLGKDQRHTFSGNAAKDFVPAEPFRFLGL